MFHEICRIKVFTHGTYLYSRVWRSSLSGGRMSAGMHGMAGLGAAFVHESKLATLPSAWCGDSGGLHGRADAVAVALLCVLTVSMTGMQWPQAGCEGAVASRHAASRRHVCHSCGNVLLHVCCDILMLCGFPCKEINGRCPHVPTTGISHC